ncbi:unnamed protein product [Vitrella brassicaformis CCMP3155]|uniref:Uncharacterized protein n=1 Tax=Vitrella brassicaformis (strain CCMP3155) TaxID=1169540 RepID=A0A0G4ELU8_VITBC|nr:unnamed protein product [Vitrella brassicaformis CCMP3155]|eukprot:CEL98092.1 unnamed protein product [Vitrella brassicaformis CCMP3155]
MSDADSSKRQRIDGPAAADHEMSGALSQDGMDVAHDASVAGGSLSFEELQRRFSVLLTQVTQVECDVTTIEGSFIANVAPKVPSVASHWSTLKSSISATSDALTPITQGMAATSPSPPPPSHPHSSLPAAHAAPTHTEHTTADMDNGMPSTLSEDLYRDVVTRFLDVAVSSARAANKTCGIDLVGETFMLTRIDTDLSRRSLRGLMDVERPFQYYTKCCYALEHGGALWCEEWAGFIRLADIYKLTPSTGLPLIMSPQWMAAHLPTKAHFHTMPLALRQYSTFGHLLNYQGINLALDKVDEAQDGKKAKEEAMEGKGDGDGEEDSEGEAGGIGQMDEPMEGDGGVTRQQYTIGNGEHQWRFETVPLSALRPRHPYRRTYDPHNPPIRYHDFLLPSFAAFVKRMVLVEWCDQEGVDEKEVFDATVADGDKRYQRLLSDAIDGRTTIDCIGWVNDDGRERYIVLKGMKEGDTVAAYLWLTDVNIVLYTTEAAIEGQERLPDRYPIAMSLVRPLLTKYRLAHLIPQ